MFLSDLSIKRPIMMTMFLLVFVLFGGIAYFSLNLNLMPDIEVPYVTVQTVYPGAGPQELESEVTKKIEDAVSTISQIKSLVSHSLEGVSIVLIEFELDKDVDIANQETKDKIDAILNDLPTDAETPVVQKIEIGAAPVVDLILSGDMTPVELYELADKSLKDRFSQINGVARVDIIGGQEREIKVELDNRIVFQNSISLLQLSQILAAENVDIPGGNFKRSSQEYTARLKGKYSSIEELKNLEINTPVGKKKLGKIANITDSGEEVRVRSTFFRNETKEKENNVVILSVIKAKDGNTVELADEIRNLVPELQKELPGSAVLEIVTDKSEFIEASVEDTLTNIGLGIILTALVLLFFLHDLRSTIIAALSMPFSIISTFMLLDISGYSLNIMTLMGLSTSVGILVANSIVVLENIFRHKEMGSGKKEAAGKGTSEVVIAVIASAMTNIVVFLPLANMSSLIGGVFKEFALTVTYATVFSIIVSFTLTPMLASIILPEGDTKKHKIGEWLEKLFKSWERGYKKALKVVVKNRLTGGITVAAAVVMFFASLFVAAQLSFEFLPLMDEGIISVEVELPQGYNLEQTAELLEKTERRIVSHEEVKNTLTQIGKINDLNQGTNLALIKIQLVDTEERELSTNEMVTIFIRELSNIPNAMFRVSAASSGAGGGMSPVEFYLQGTDLVKLEIYKSELETKLKTIEGLTNLNTSSRAGKPEITLLPDRVKLANAGLTAYDLAMTLRAGMEGLTPTKFSDGGEEYEIRVSLNDESIDSPEEIANMTVISPVGKYTLNQLAEIKFTDGYSRILHRDKAKTIQFTGGVAEGFALGDIVNEVEEEIDSMEFESGYSISWAGTAEMMNEVIFDMGFAFSLALILTYMLLAAILESFTQPLMILATIPMALIGVFLALYSTGLAISVLAMLAIVMLIGIVVNNAILLLDYTNILVKRGYEVKDALIEACPTKLKPVIMSTIAIMLGMLPMALGIGSAGKEFRQPIGVVSIGGLLISGVITLFVIPALYELTHRSKKAAEGDNDE
ncbi:MAG: efflux RND transporter permease subunit [Ignavibacteriae bacterium]|nr:efflux RND transporter permease subunit [Ignavibacteriota bacterium]NOG98391.1 efflux RND transporter permease subunit [Ignavibacteriota bacterium]